ncbi:hypothetical protein [Mycoplasma mycoides]|uniref:Glucokinase n=1 Tax=Mycoplasma mycoides subsp. mycoides TaxID=2103 RepID=A0AAE2EIV1_MYCMY|nr:hypothetical protein [Mycoplasma mycoides]ADK69756.1 hypothetical protein MMS_A0961 [Mycoplasma mycoides subsp. mycoides SC str. Gladysdale]AMK56228.1 hypothetical protein MSCT144_03070 [Mycoplasma mycoides subsp. mycoides]KJQ46265.1 hypothetical protein TS59_0964 [Mycoplasma mycoides subsp. mycoides]KJQ46806.1 hypothetical protein TS60_0982 [Mycoplasma mycoides subsp. mycoides]
MKKILGIDLGGTSAKVEVISQNGDLEHSFPTFPSLSIKQENILM